MSSENQRAKMVGWYDPVQLIRTGAEVLISSIFGKYADQRLLQALAAGPGVIYDCSQPVMKTIELGPPSGEVSSVAPTLEFMHRREARRMAYPRGEERPPL